MSWPVAPSNLDLKISDPRSSLRLHSAHRAGGCFPTPLTAPALGLFESVAAAASADPALEETGGEAHIPCRIDGLSLCVELRCGAVSALTSLFAAEISCAPLNAADREGLHLIALVPPLGGGGLRAARAAGGGDTVGAPVWYLVFDRDRIGQAEIQRELCRLGCLRTDLHRVYRALPCEGAAFGRGASACVKRMFDWDGGVAAVKVMNPSADPEQVQREVATLLTVQSHSNVIGYVAMFWAGESPRFHLVLEAATGGDVYRRVKSMGALPEAEARKLFAGAMRGLQHVHRKGVVHRDVKADNILISGSESDERAQLADFGLAAFLSDEAQMARRCGSPGYVAPEVCLGGRYGSNVDVFGMGVVLHYMLSKEFPFAAKGGDQRATLQKTVECRLQLRKPPWESHSVSLRSILRSTICKDPEERLSSAGALSHVWMRTHSSGRARNSGKEKPSGVAEQVERKSMAQQRNEAVHSTVASSEVLPQGAAYPTPMVYPKLLCPRLYCALDRSPACCPQR